MNSTFFSSITCGKEFFFFCFFHSVFEEPCFPIFVLLVGLLFYTYAVPGIDDHVAVERPASSDIYYRTRKHITAQRSQPAQADRVGSSPHVAQHLYNNSLCSQNEQMNRNLPGLEKYQKYQRVYNNSRSSLRSWCDARTVCQYTAFYVSLFGRRTEDHTSAPAFIRFLLNCEQA